MKPPSMNARRWFWTLLTLVLAWLCINEKWLTPADTYNQPGIANSAQSWVSNNLVRTFLLPASATLHWAQEHFEHLAQSASPDAAPSPDVLKLAEENQRLHEQNLYYASVVQELNDKLHAVGQLRDMPLLSDRNFIAANVRGFAPGLTGQAVVIDRGETDSVHAGDFVVARSSIVGRVASAGARVALVRLITNPRRDMWLTARLLRQTSANTLQIICPQIEVQGTPEGPLRCQSVEATSGTIPPEKGDIVQLEDNRWALVRHFNIGEVTDVSRLEGQNLRYDLKIQPVVSASQLSQVWVIAN